MNRLFKIFKFILKEESNKKQRIRRLFYALCWQIWKRTVKKPLIINLDNGAKYIAHPKTPMGSFPIYARIYDSDKIIFLRKFLKEGGIFIDIGANMGVYPLLLKDKFRKFILFEPIKETANICEANMKLNGIKYELYGIALGNSSGEIKFDFKGNFDTTAKISKDSGNYIVKIDKLDNIIPEKYYGDLSFIKIDVEGFELDVLKGAEKIIEESSVRLIQFERLKTTPLEPLLEFFKKRGWKVFALGKGKLPSFDGELIKHSHDLFAIKGEL